MASTCRAYFVRFVTASAATMIASSHERLPDIAMSVRTRPLPPDTPDEAPVEDRGGGRVRCRVKEVVAPTEQLARHGPVQDGAVIRLGAAPSSPPPLLRTRLTTPPATEKMEDRDQAPLGVSPNAAKSSKTSASRASARIGGTCVSSRWDLRLVGEPGSGPQHRCPPRHQRRWRQSSVRIPNPELAQGAKFCTTCAPDFGPLLVDLPVDLQEHRPELTSGGLQSMLLRGCKGGKFQVASSSQQRKQRSNPCARGPAP